MKKIWIGLIIIIALACQRKISQRELPLPVQSSFNCTFPEATNIKWIKWEKSGKTYEAKFHQRGRHIDAQYKNDGSLIKSQ
jgi:hypothetical protein